MYSDCDSFILSDALTPHAQTRGKTLSLQFPLGILFSVYIDAGIPSSALLPFSTSVHPLFESPFRSLTDVICVVNYRSTAHALSVIITHLVSSACASSLVRYIPAPTDRPAGRAAIPLPVGKMMQAIRLSIGWGGDWVGGAPPRGFPSKMTTLKVPHLDVLCPNCRRP